MQERKLPSGNCYNLIVKREQIIINNNITRLITTLHGKFYEKKKRISKQRQDEVLKTSSGTVKARYAIYPVSCEHLTFTAKHEFPRIRNSEQKATYYLHSCTIHIDL